MRLTEMLTAVMLVLAACVPQSGDRERLSRDQVADMVAEVLSVQLPSSARDVRGLRDFRQGRVVFIRFTCPQGDVEEFLSSPRLAGVLVAPEPWDGGRRVGAERWWRPDEVDPKKSTSGNWIEGRDVVYCHVLAGPVDRQADWTVYIRVSFTVVPSTDCPLRSDKILAACQPCQGESVGKTGDL